MTLDQGVPAASARTNLGRGALVVEANAQAQTVFDRREQVDLAFGDQVDHQNPLPGSALGLGDDDVRGPISVHVGPAQ
jgi:hypothetical protein